MKEMVSKMTKGVVPKIVMGTLVVFFIYCLYCVRQAVHIVPHFLKNIVSLDILTTIIYPVTVAPCIVFPIILIIMAKYMKKRREAKGNGPSMQSAVLNCVSCFLGAIAIVLIVCDLIKLTAEDRVKRFLDKASAEVTVTIDGEPIQNPYEVITELKKIAPLPGHRSHTTKAIAFEVVSNGETLRLCLGRDSYDNQQYWVFYPNYRYTSRNEIGRIVTNIFDDY